MIAQQNVFEMLPRKYQRCEPEPDSIVPVLDCQEKTAEELIINTIWMADQY